MQYWLADRRPLIAALALWIGFGALLLLMGRPPICPCGSVELWHGAVQSAGNSQHLSDWYSLSHVIHGFIFYALIAWAARRWPGLGAKHSPAPSDSPVTPAPSPVTPVKTGVHLPPLLARWALLLAILIEGAWEMIENTPLVINRYREATAAWGYSGDSVLNSMSDIGMMAAGFWIASRLPWKATLALAVTLELIALVAIRDNLTLNVLMLLFPSEGVAEWQAAGQV